MRVTIRTVAVIGAGTMGAGIAQVCAQAGWNTRLFDAFPEGLDAGMNRIDAFWNKGIERGKTTAEQKQIWEQNLAPYSELADAVNGVDLVIEAVPEILELKRKIFSELDHLAPENAVLGTNTSGLKISDIASATRRPDKVIGMHFFNPVPIMKLLELVRHDAVADSTIPIAKKSVKQWARPVFWSMMSRALQPVVSGSSLAMRPFECWPMESPVHPISIRQCDSDTSIQWAHWN